MNAPLTAPAAPIVISQYEALRERIAIAQQDATAKVFDLTTGKGEKECRSYLYSLRVLKADIDRARKEAKSYALEYGRKVDSAAKELEAQVDAVMAPHEEAIKALEAKEAARVASHTNEVNAIVALRAIPAGTTSAAIAERLAKAKVTSTDHLQEFKAKADGELLTTIRALEQQYHATLTAEAEAAELARLRAEAAAREEADRQERIRQEAIAAERARAEEAERKRLADEAAAKAIAEARAKAEAERKDREAREAIEAAERKEREAKDAADRAAKAQAEAEARAKAAEEAARRAAEQAEADAAARAAAEEAAQRAEVERQERIRQAEAERRDDLIAAIAQAMRGKTAAQVAAAIVAGELHPAISIDWNMIATHPTETGG